MLHRQQVILYQLVGPVLCVLAHRPFQRPKGSRQAKVFKPNVNFANYLCKSSEQSLCKQKAALSQKAFEGNRNLLNSVLEIC